MCRCKQNKLIPKISVDHNFVLMSYIMHDYVYYIASKTTVLYKGTRYDKLSDKGKVISPT